MFIELAIALVIATVIVALYTSKDVDFDKF